MINNEKPKNITRVRYETYAPSLPLNPDAWIVIDHHGTGVLSPVVLARIHKSVPMAQQICESVETVLTEAAATVSKKINANRR